ncbi:MAG: hypothetical protein QGH40_09595 [bacterium]|nr:hypothetical protein [bacterium]
MSGFCTRSGRYLSPGNAHGSAILAAPPLRSRQARRLPAVLPAYVPYERCLPLLFIEEK